MRRYLTSLSCLLFAAVLTAPVAAGDPASAHYGRGSASVFWFMHLSDTHIGSSLIEGPDASPHLETALGSAVGVINPVFVVNSGDLCDGSKFDIPTTGQEQAEWNEYKQIYTQAGMTPSFYFDLPGNHDGYGDVGMSFYLANSLQGSTNNSLYTSWTVQTPVGEYFFFGLDSAGNGSGPFVEQPDFTADEIAALDTELGAHDNDELSFVLGHHPVDVPAHADQVLSALSAHQVGYYLHGHVHSYSEYLANSDTVVVNEVDTLGKGNTDNIGVGAVDHNAFIYRAADVVDPWPFILVTAPVDQNIRDGSTAHPYSYSVCKDRVDNPVRALVFSAVPPTEVTAQVGSLPPVAMSLVPATGSLYLAEIDTSSLGAGSEIVTVAATADGASRQASITADFVDGPCEGLPDDGDGAGGAGGGAGAGGFGGGGFGGGGSGAAGGGGVGAGAAGGAAMGGSAATPYEFDVDGGCGCRLAGEGPRSPRAGWLMLLALPVLCRRRRRLHTRMRSACSRSENWSPTMASRLRRALASALRM